MVSPVQRLRAGSDFSHWKLKNLFLKNLLLCLLCQNGNIGFFIQSCQSDGCTQIILPVSAADLPNWNQFQKAWIEERCKSLLSLWILLPVAAGREEHSPHSLSLAQCSGRTKISLLKLLSNWVTRLEKSQIILIFCDFWCWHIFHMCVWFWLPLACISLCLFLCLSLFSSRAI